MINKLLIANRGEIACRVIKTARRMGIVTVAVYSDADATAKHVAMADEAVHIGPSPVGESYLLGDVVIAAARRTGADAIHPGYGFLSENPEFVDAVEAAGLIFVGPTSDAIRAMGLKDAAKVLMEKAGVPVVPGYHGSNQDPDFLAAEAEKIGYPVLIKARAGGGGKGMRLVERPEDFKTGLEGAQREGAASFGDPACLIEKYITKPRHIEIQVFGDSHGNVVHLFERDCSLQRRHQKVIEEAPAPDMPAEVRAAMGEAAVDAAKAVNYQGAGTVEFIVDGSNGLRADGFWFMEMNTRLQVEHPVSEAISGLDFVELQLCVASGDALPFAQCDLAINGWSFEARVYAEDVPKGFLPATGKLDHLSFPEGAEFQLGATRIDSGVRQSDTISPYYDPMIAKVIVHGPTREIALAKLRAALAGCHVTGSVTNIEFLSALAANDSFKAGDVDTDLIARDLDTLTRQTPPSDFARALAALAALGFTQTPNDVDPWQTLTGWRTWAPDRIHIGLSYDDIVMDCYVTVLGKQHFMVEGLEKPVSLALEGSPDGRLIATSAGHKTAANLVINASSISVFMNGQKYDFNLIDPLALAGAAEDGGDSIIAPMPGLLKVIHGKAGQTVSKGDPMLLLEAMKMEHTLTAPRDGVIDEVMVSVGDQIDDGTVLLTLVPENTA